MPWNKGRPCSEETIRKITKYPVNDTLFDTIDNEHSAYWLGRIAADGNSNSATGITLSAAERDAANIKQFRDWISPSRPIHVVAQKKVFAGVEKTYMRHAVTVSSRRLASVLLTHGIVPRKTLLLTGPPDTVSPTMLRHYYRGYFDSDGSVWVGRRRRSKHNCTFALLGTEPFLLRFKLWAEENASVRLYAPVPKAQTKIWRLACDGLERVSLLMRLLYADTTVYLARKQERAMTIMAAHHAWHTKSDGFHVSDTRKQQARDLYATGQYTVTEVARIVGIGYGTAYSTIRNKKYY